MREYDVWFSIFGKKMKTKIFAENPDEVKKKIKNNIVFYKIKECVNNNDTFENLLDIFGLNK